MKDLYAIFGVAGNSSRSEIRQAYCRLARQTHPDVADSGDSRRFREIQEAWETLRCPRRRSEYDEQLRRHRQAAHHRRPTAFKGHGSGERGYLKEPAADLELVLDSVV